jgi:agmatinase
MSSPNPELPTSGRVALIGVPFDGQSSFLRGAAAAPTEIRRELLCDSGNLSTEAGLDLATESRWSDLGDLHLSDATEPLDAIAKKAATILDRGDRLLALGGDHSVTYPLVRAHALRYGPLSIVHFDAHPDLYEEFEGNRLSHACPFARILEEGCARRLIQVGIRASNLHQREQASRYGVETLTAWNLQDSLLTSLQGPIYLSIDLDVLDPAFAPGVSHREPGGLSTRQLLDLIRSIPNQVVGADLVELNPSRDRDGISARAAAKITKELLGLLLESCPTSTESAGGKV